MQVAISHIVLSFTRPSSAVNCDHRFTKYSAVLEYPPIGPAAGTRQRAAAASHIVGYQIARGRSVHRALLHRERCLCKKNVCRVSTPL
jgi:hypothetical protein